MILPPGHEAYDSSERLNLNRSNGLKNDKMIQQSKTNTCQQARQQIIQHNAKAAVDMTIYPADWPGFGDIKNPE